MQSLLPLAVTAAIAVPSAPAAAQVTQTDGTVPIYDITPQPVPTPVPVPTSTPTATPTPRPLVVPTVRATATPVPTPRATPVPRPTPAPTSRANPVPNVAAPVATAESAPVPDPVEQVGTVEDTPASATVDTPSAGAEQAAPADPASGIPGWLWFVAGLAVAGLIALVLGKRRRGDVAFEVAQPVDVPVPATAPPAPVAVPTPPVPATPPTPQTPPTSSTPPVPPVPAPLPPRALEFQLAPLRVGLQGEQALLDFDLSVGNATDIPVEEVRIATLLLTANARQDEQIAAFLADDAAAALDPFPVAPGERRRLEATMSLPKGALTIVTANERPFFVPVMAIDARYRWADGRESRTSAAFVVGPVLPNGKLSPVFVDRGDRMVDRLEARLHGEVRRS
ncbi:hypothetical protein [Sphingomonas sp. CFBP 13720]|uniref:hypothetical protein n=1 Tax=Sphingomonas sp. CFBP 13720 TaxID=2775302 RepID=UPI00177E45C6|nr:hypothetical protein [Sphingomonas sp. CFBP 13720]MBD8677801.1 hypothetical protein [Sphingomonas sp. CFBP 13720]